MNQVQLSMQFLTMPSQLRQRGEPSLSSLQRVRVFFQLSEEQKLKCQLEYLVVYYNMLMRKNYLPITVTCFIIYYSLSPIFLVFTKTLSDAIYVTVKSWNRRVLDLQTENKSSKATFKLLHRGQRSTLHFLIIYLQSQINKSSSRNLNHMINNLHNILVDHSYFDNISTFYLFILLHRELTVELDFGV